MPRRKRATIREVAQATGLSPAAVSYALRGTRVSQRTQRRVRQAAEELGYEVDPIARALARGRTEMVGLLCGSLGDLWQQQLAQRIGRALLERDRYALILDAAGDPDREPANAQRLHDQRVDALIVQPLDPAAPHWATLAAQVPIVAIGDGLRDAPTAGEVVFDNRRGVTAALQHLRALGHRHIAVLTPTGEDTQDRPADVYVHAEVARLGLRADIRSSPHTLAGATAVATEALRARPRPTALFCFADSIAYGGYAAARELGLRVPDEVSIMGYDDHPMSALLSPPLTTVDWDIDGIVAAAVELAVQAMDDTARGARVVLAPTLRNRGSTDAHRAES